MKVTVPAHEITDGKIELVSLVKHGANRMPFTILKAEAPKTERTPMSKMHEMLKKMIGGKSEPVDAPKIVGVFVRKSAAAEAFPILKAHGLRVEKEHSELVQDVVVLKQDGYAEDGEGMMIALTPDIGVALDRVVKGFNPYPYTGDFATNVEGLSFSPGLYAAQDALRDAIWNHMYNSATPEEAVAGVRKACADFSSYVEGMVSALPSTLFKMEGDLLKSQFGARSVASTSDSTTQNEGDHVNTQINKREAMAGDLDGLFDETVKKSETPPAADSATAPKPEKAQLPEGEAPSDPTPAPVEDAITKTTEAKPDAPTTTDTTEAPVPGSLGAVLKSLEVIAGSLVKMSEGQQALIEKVAAQDAKIESIAKAQGEVVAKAEKAIEKAENTAVVTGLPALDQSLATLSGDRTSRADLRKADNEQGGSIWKGLIPAFDAIDNTERG